ncbi:MAG TPA: hypothetical protein VL625_12225, partial [Patescibacteria group bacterium]|nr:hypothetical protein [Patescibacteria group bacterium]
MASSGAAAVVRKQRALSLLFWTLFSVPIIVWSCQMAGISLSSDTIWLTESMRRILGGGRLGTDVYELNPPLDMFTYTLPWFAAQTLHLPFHYAVFAWTLSLTVISAAIVHAILRGWTFLERSDASGVTATLIVANTIICSTSFGERDQYVGLALIPFTLLQAALTFNLPRPRRMTWPVFAIGSLFILLKPDHGLVPAIMLAFRAVRQKRLPLRDPDFVCLAVSTTAYIAATWLLFPAFPHDILPDVMKLYVPLRAPHILRKTLGWLAATLVLLLVTGWTNMPRERKVMTLMLEAAALLSLIPYFVQGRGFYYHLFPLFSFAACALGLLLPWLMRRDMQAKHTLFASIAILTGFAWIFVPPVKGYPLHAEYKNLSVPSLVNSVCGEKPDCTFFMFSNNMGIVHETAYYTGHEHASRFASFWFVPWLVTQQDMIARGLP